jgi:hypothetical protein
MLKQLKGARIVVLLIVAVLPFALIACGGDSKKDTYKSDADDVNAALSVWILVCSCWSAA